MVGDGSKKRKGGIRFWIIIWMIFGSKDLCKGDKLSKGGKGKNRGMIGILYYNEN